LLPLHISIVLEGLRALQSARQAPSKKTAHTQGGGGTPLAPRPRPIFPLPLIACPRRAAFLAIHISKSLYRLSPLSPHWRVFCQWGASLSTRTPKCPLHLSPLPPPGFPTRPNPKNVRSRARVPWNTGAQSPPPLSSQRPANKRKKLFFFSCAFFCHRARAESGARLRARALCAKRRRTLHHLPPGPRRD
jgi:hypothetical protein